MKIRSNDKNSVVANFATTASDGKTYQVDYYNLDVIISVGYRVKSTLLIAESNPKEKVVIIDLVMNFLND